MRRLFSALAIVITMAASSATAATITLKADGTGDYPTIQDAVDAATPGDEIVLEAGTYTGSGNDDVTVSTTDLTIRGDQGAAMTTITGTSTATATFFVSVSSGSFTLAGLTIQDSERALICNYADLTVTDLTVLNAAEWGLTVQFAPDVLLQGVTVRESTRGINLARCDNMLIEDCAVIASDYLALYIVDGIAAIDNFYCHGNATIGGSGIHILDITSVIISGSTICHNGNQFGPSDDGSGIVCEALCTITQCTIAVNEGGPAVTLLGGGSIDQTIIASTQGGAGLDAAGVSISDCNIWGNSGGDGLGGGADAGGNISADPLFCGAPGSENYYLTSVSPCTAANSPGGVLIGAWPTGCGPVKTEETSWGALKAIYR